MAVFTPTTPPTTPPTPPPTTPPPMRPPQARPSAGPGARPGPRRPPIRYRPWPSRPGLRRLAVAGAVAGLTGAILAFSHAWTNGGLPFDGPGEVLHLRLALDQWHALGKLAPWLPQMWSGTPIWTISASVPVLLMMPYASVFGVENAVKFGCLGAQILGAVGVFVLARSLWGRGSASVLAGLFYGLAPMFVAHSLFGADRISWVLGLTPWVVWSLRRACRGEGRRRGLPATVGAGVLVGVALLEQGELVYSLGLLCGVVFLLELRNAGEPAAGGESRLPRKTVLLRGAGVCGIGLGLAAHWLLPFVAMSKEFVLSPPSIVERELKEGVAALLARNPGAFVTRSPGATPTGDFASDLLGMGPFYLSFVLILATAGGMALLRRYDKRNELTAILIASAFGVWLSSGAIPLAASGPAERRQVLPFMCVGIIAGFLVGTLLATFRARRWAVAAGAATGALLISLPYVTPFQTLQRVVPLLDSIRFPRFYTVALLGLALGAAFPVSVLERRLRGREPRLTALVAAAASLALAGLFLVDMHTYRSYYEVYPPDSSYAYRQLTKSLEGGTPGQRIASGEFNPEIYNELVTQGIDQSTGWPHPIASKRVWDVTAQTLLSPDGYRDSALALSATSAVITEVPITRPDGNLMLDHIRLERNPLVLPKVRAYDHIVVARRDDLATEMAIRVSQRNVGTISAKAASSYAARVLGPDGATDLGSRVDCNKTVLTATPQQYAGEAAMACAARDRLRSGDSLGGFVIRTVPNDGAGAIFQSPLADLEGVAVWMPAGPSVAELALYELAPNGRSLGQEVRRTLATGYDTNGMVSFTFDPVKESERRRYVFVLECSRCPSTDTPAMVVAMQRSRPGDAVLSGKIEPDATGVFIPLYARTPAAAPSATVVKPTALGAGRWRIETSGAKPSLVVVAEAWFPGWKATVDGKSVPVEKADAAFLGVAVGAGDHVITLSYHNSAAVTLGRLISGITIIVVIALAWPTDLTRRLWPNAPVLRSAHDQQRPPGARSMREWFLPSPPSSPNGAPRRAPPSAPA